jgi:hypothetical protein
LIDGIKGIASGVATVAVMSAFGGFDPILIAACAIGVVLLAAFAGPAVVADRRRGESQRRKRRSAERAADRRQQMIATMGEEARFLLHHAAMDPDREILRRESLGERQIWVNHFKIGSVYSYDPRPETEFVAFEKAIRMLQRTGLLQRVMGTDVSGVYRLTPEGWDAQSSLPPPMPPERWTIVRQYSEGPRASRVLWP